MNIILLQVQSTPDNSVWFWFVFTESGNCSKCPLGTYQPDQGQKECILCGQNFTTALNGTSKESDCIGNVS